MRQHFATTLTFFWLACSARTQPISDPPNLTATPTPTTLPVRPTVGAVPATTSPIRPTDGAVPTDATPPQRSVKDTAPSPIPCGALDCLAFASADAAVRYLLATTSPYVLSVGEIHAQKDKPLKMTTPQLFARLLPLFKDHAKHLVLELWTGRNDCPDARVAKVKEAQKAVTEPQNAANQNDYLELGHQSKKLGIFPQALVPSCDDYQSILTAKSKDIAKMLELTATKTKETVELLLKRATGEIHVPFIITYGGALHNDLAPKPGRETWSFGPDLQRVTAGHVVELDLVQREQVRDTESFTKLPWYPYYRQQPLEEMYALYKTGEASYTLIFAANNDTP